MNADTGQEMTLEVTAVTHKGKVREHNEDTIAVDDWICGDSMDAPCRFVCDLPKPPHGTLVLVADGMGGHVGGREASRRAAEAMVGMAGTARSRAADGARPELAEVLCRANRELFDAAAADPALRGMGTTIAGIVAMADRVTWFNVGDSRVYSVRPEYLRQLSIDDVPAGAAAGSGRITQALGGAPSFVDVVPHVGSEAGRAGRRYLLCSDGLTDMLSPEDIERAISDDDRVWVEELLERTLAAGARDNVSIVVASVKGKVTGGEGQAGPDRGGPHAPNQ